jgi:hypothetical protein
MSKSLQDNKILRTNTHISERPQANISPPFHQTIVNSLQQESKQREEELREAKKKRGKAGREERAEKRKWES